MQCTANGPVANTQECEKMLGEVAENVLVGGYTGQGFQDNQIQFIKNVQKLCVLVDLSCLEVMVQFGGISTVYR